MLTRWAYDHAAIELLAHGITPATDALQRFEQYRQNAPAWLTCQASGCNEPDVPVRVC
jgi:hypothetical protein